jgi:glycosyltransferase 2 family protein
MKRGRLLWLLAAVSATLAIGYFVVRKLDFHDLARLGRAANPGLLLLGLSLYVLANLLRALRFRALTGDQLPTVALLRTVFIQNFLNTFLPLRAGEVSYLVMVHRTGVVTPGANLASLLGARVLDLVAALMIPLVTLPMSRAWAGAELPLGWFATSVVVASALLALGLWQAQRLAGWLELRAAAANKWLLRALTTAAEALRALSQLRQGHMLGRVALLTAGCWILIYLSGYVTMLGVGAQVPFWDALFAYSFPVVASMMPFYMLGGFGVYEGSIGFGLHLVGVPLESSMAIGVLLHVAELLFVVIPAPFGIDLRSAKAPDVSSP